MQRPRTSIVLAALIAGVCYAIVVVQLLAARGGDVSRFVVAGGPGVDARSVPPGLTVIPGIGGYDGGAFYRLALNPFTRVVTAHGITLDNPAYRQQRIGYPLIVWALSLGGQPQWIPWMLVLTNVVALMVMAGLAAALCERYGYHGLWGLAIPFFPGFLWTLSRDLSEIVACTFALAAIVAIVHRRFLLGAALLSYAVITRETALAIAGGLLCAYVLARVRRRPTELKPIVFILPILVYVAGQLILAAVWGQAPVRAGQPGISVPFAEFVNAWVYAWPRRIQLQRLYFVECVFLALEVVVTLLVVIRFRSALQWVLAWMANLTVAAVLAPGSWVADLVFLRILCDLHLLGGVIVVTADSRVARAVLLVATLSLWIHVAKIAVALQ